MKVGLTKILKEMRQTRRKNETEGRNLGERKDKVCWQKSGGRKAGGITCEDDGASGRQRWLLHHCPPPPTVRAQEGGHTALPGCDVIRQEEGKD